MRKNVALFSKSNILHHGPQITAVEEGIRMIIKLISVVTHKLFKSGNFNFNTFSHTQLFNSWRTKFSFSGTLYVIYYISELDHHNKTIKFERYSKFKAFLSK